MEDYDENWLWRNRVRGVDYTYLAQDRDRWRDVVNTVMNLRVPWKSQNFLTRLRNCQILKTGSSLCSSYLIILSKTKIILRRWQIGREWSTAPSATLSTTNTIQTNLKSKPGLRGVKTATNRLTLFCFISPNYRTVTPVNRSPITTNVGSFCDIRQMLKIKAVFYIPVHLFTVRNNSNMPRLTSGWHTEFTR